MRKFVINVNGNSYEVDVEEVKGGIQGQGNVSEVTRAVTQVQVPTPAPTTQAPAAPTPAPISEQKKEVKVSAGQEVIEAPMPGNILRIEVSEGQEIKAGDILLILEAMKMENEILAPSDGKVISVLATVGASVNSGDKLIVIE